MKSWPLLAAACVALPLIAVAADYPQWRGPNRDGKSPETGLLKEWPEEGPPLVWKLTDIGDGYSTPSVVGERLYVQANRGLDDEFLQSRSVSDGKRVWETRLGKVGNPDQKPPYPGSRSTPTVDGERIYALSSDGDLVCVKTDSGEVVWKKSFRADFGGEPGVWAYSESPLVDGEVVVGAPGGNDATVVALNKTNGELIWKLALPGGSRAAYSSPIAIEVGGVRQYVFFLEAGLVGVEAQGGALLWTYDRTAKGSLNNMPTPVSRDGYVYSSSRQSGGGMIKLLVDKQREFAVEEAFFSRKLPVSIGGAIEVDGYLYGTNSEAMLCVKFTTGDVQWQNRSIGAASLCYADGHFYLHGENGDLALVEATPKEYREKGRFTPADQPERGRSKAWTYPVIANGRLYIRDLGTLWCYDIAEKKN